eukprot:12911427-Heterocapsa_arctica.AAC.1
MLANGCDDGDDAVRALGQEAARGVWEAAEDVCERAAKRTAEMHKQGTTGVVKQSEKEPRRTRP